MRSIRARAWDTGDRAAWAKLTWDDFVRFIREIARSGLKGLALLFAALIGVGSVLVDANVVSAIIVLGSGIGFFFSLALKNDKGGFMSAGLLLFGVMTIWLPPVRTALFLYPLATISVLVCLGLIFKFAQAGGTVGLMTGGVLALYLIGVIVNDTQRQERRAPRFPSSIESKKSTAPIIRENQGALTPPPQAVAPPAVQPQSPSPPEHRTLIASKGAVLKFVAGVTYRLKIRTGFTTSLRASHGRIALYSGDEQTGECDDSFDFPMRADAKPYQEIEQVIRACGVDAIIQVVDVR